LPARAEVGCLCPRCFTQTDATLADIADMHARLAAGLPLVVDDTHDPVSHHTPAGAVSTSGAPRVSGTPSPSSPISLDVFDLLLPARTASVSYTHTYRKYLQRTGLGLDAVTEWRDQYGQPSVAAVLDSWARDWHDLLHDPLPNPTVAALVVWLRARLERAAKSHPAIDEFITETRSLRGRLQAVLHERDPDPELCRGVACRYCDQRTLWRRPDGSRDVDCHSCGQIYRPDEYHRWTVALAASTKRMVEA